MGLGHIATMTSRLQGSGGSYADKHGHGPGKADDGGVNLRDIEPGVTAALGHHPLTTEVWVRVCMYTVVMVVAVVAVETTAEVISVGTAEVCVGAAGGTLGRWNVGMIVVSIE